MYGTCETPCQLLGELYPAGTPLNLIIWSPMDIKTLANEVGYAVSEQDTGAVLACMGVIPREQRLESSMSTGTVMGLIKQMKEAASGVVISAELLKTLLIIAEQALWCRGQTTRDKNHPVPKSITRRLADVAEIRALLKR